MVFNWNCEERIIFWGMSPGIDMTREIENDHMNNEIQKQIFDNFPDLRIWIYRFGS
jgi:hypothetical protein